MRYSVKEIRLYERPVKLRLPFRFGVVTLREAPQAFARVRLETSKGASAWGMAAELMAPKWFDKNTALSNEDNFGQLRRSLALTRNAYLDAGAKMASTFALFAAHYPEQVRLCAAEGLNQLIAGYGPALLDRAVLDAFCRLETISFADAVRANLCGIDPGGLAPDLRGFDMDGFLAALEQRPGIHARHTVGLVDPLDASQQGGGERVGDGLPETLEEVVACYGHRYFKLKVGGDVDEDRERLRQIAAVLDQSPQAYYVTLDGNEQYDDVQGVLELWRAITAEAALRRLVEAILFIEQPIKRQQALQQSVLALSEQRPVIIDESDAALDSLLQAKALGYNGVSSKTCKGIYRSLINAARCESWNRENPGVEYFLTGEDLSTQAGLSVQQDLALVCLLGLEHVERNGHHYVDGFAAAPASEARAFLQAHPDLYRFDGGRVRLRIRDGWLEARSLTQTGYAANAAPDWSAMREMSC